MADLLPSSPDPSAGDGGDPRVIGVDSDDADDLLGALQSETARDVLGALYDEPATPSGLAEEVDTSLQNVRYHLEKLADAELVEVADTVYSEKGREMKVYAPAAKPLVVFAGNDDETPGIEAALSRLLGGLGVLGLSSLAVQRIFGSPEGVGSSVGTSYFAGGESAAGTTASQDAGAEDPSLTYAEEDATAGSENATGGGGGGPNGESGTSKDAPETTQEAATTTQDAAETTLETTEATRTAEETQTTQAVGDASTTEEAAETTVAEPTATETEVAQATETIRETTRTLAETTTEEAARSTTTVADAAGSAVGSLPPGLLFFAGGLVVLLAFGLAWYVRGH